MRFGINPLQGGRNFGATVNEPCMAEALGFDAVYFSDGSAGPCPVVSLGGRVTKVPKTGEEDGADAGGPCSTPKDADVRGIPGLVR